MVVVSGAGRGMRPQSKKDLSWNRRRMVEKLQEINFGRMEGIEVREGEPVLDPLPVIIREIKFGGENGPRPELQAEDFPLKSQLVELFQRLDAIGNGHVEVLEIKHGLPFRMMVREAAA